METFTRSVAIPAVSDFTVDDLYLSWSKAVIQITLKGAQNQVLTHAYSGATATTFMTQLNKANLSTAGNSLHRRIIDRLIADGVIAGSVSGSPD